MAKIPKPEGIKKVITKNGYTKDIIDSILRIDKTFFDAEFCEFSRKKFKPTKEGLEKLWNFVKYQIEYKRDEDGISVQGTPLATWKLKTADCKNKTIFVNAVLRCIGIPYLIRFTNYERGKKDVSHVYTVAIFEGKELPIDTVYDWFGSEKKYNKKIDYDMTQIIEIAGIEPSSTVLVPVTRTTQYEYIPQVYQKCNTDFPVTPAALLLQEIKQKQKYVVEPEPIEFSKLNEAQAALKIVERELEIIAVMRPELSKVAKQGIELIRKTKGTDFCITGDVPPELNKLASKIRSLEKMQQYAANGWGILQQRINAYKRNKKANSAEVAAFPERVCLNNLWFSARPTTINPTTGLVTNSAPNFAYTNYAGGTAPYPIGSQNNGFCGISPGMWADYSYEKIFLNNGNPKPAATELEKNKYLDFFYYGRNTPYRVSYAEFGNKYENVLLPKLITDNLAFGRGQSNSGTDSFWFNNDSDYNAALNMLKQGSGVFDKFINDIYSANATANPHGTIGSGLLYTFSGTITYQGQQVPINSLPPSVLSKLGFQNQFLDASTGYSGVSRTNIQGLARNGVLYDNGGKQPELTLQQLFAIYENPASINCPMCPIIAAIVAIVSAIVGAIIGAVEKSNKAEDQARGIDTALTDTARLSRLGPSLMPEQNDFQPTLSGGNTGGGGNNNNTGTSSISPAIVLGSLAAGALLLGKKKGKKKSN